MSLATKVLKSLSGGDRVVISKQLIFNKVIGVKGLTSGAGTSTLVQSLAYYFSTHKNMRVCVVDTNFLNPVQETLLGAHLTGLDMLDFKGDVSKIILKTKYKNLFLVSLSKRGITEMVSRDDSEVYKKVLRELKTLFDVIIVDIADEPTCIATDAAIKCNRIISVADQSLKCVYNLRSTLNRNATLAIPREKLKWCILNKAIKDVRTTTVQSLQDSGLTVMGEILYSQAMARKGLTGEVCYDLRAEDVDYKRYSEIVQHLAESILSRTPNNEELHGNEVYTPTKENTTTKNSVEQKKIKQGGFFSKLFKSKNVSEVESSAVYEEVDDIQNGYDSVTERKVQPQSEVEEFVYDEPEAVVAPPVPEKQQTVPRKKNVFAEQPFAERENPVNIKPREVEPSNTSNIDEDDELLLLDD